MAKRILIVDDSISSRGMVGLVLGAGGFECTEACNGAEALKLLSLERFDLVITDHWMPSMTGLELVKNIRDKPDLAGLPIVVITTDVDVSRCLEYKGAGVTATINKPFSREELVSVVSRVVGE